MHGSSFLSALLATLFSASLPPAVIYLETSRLARRFKLHRSRGKWDRIQKKRTVESQPAMSQNKAFNTAIAADRCLLLTDLHLWNSYHWHPTHLFSDSLPFFYYYLGLEETTTHPSYNLSPIYHMISNSVLSLHPHKCLLPHFQGISHTTLHGTFLPYVQCLKLHLQSKGLS